MSEGPKFQRRKRRNREHDDSAAAPVRASSTRKKSSNAKRDADARIAELQKQREELLRKKADMEAAREAKAAKQATARPAQAKSDDRAEPPLILAQPQPSAPVREPVAPEIPAYDPETAWNAMDSFELDLDRLARGNVVTALREDPSHTRFDILRTRMLQALSDNGWRRIAITSPTKGCGKTFTAANLIISMSRQDNCRAVLLDMDMRAPNLHNIFDVRDPGCMADMLRGEIAPHRQLQRFAPNDIGAGRHAAIGFNGVAEEYASELIQEPATGDALQLLNDTLQPDVVLYDLPPALVNDDVLAMRPHFDAVLLVAGGGLTSAKEIKEVERRLGENVPLLGVILNRADDANSREQAY